MDGFPPLPGKVFKLFADIGSPIGVLPLKQCDCADDVDAVKRVYLYQVEWYHGS